jgi:5-methylthioadenosine/S-adenosylhomocysteine deaminase
MQRGLLTPATQCVHMTQIDDSDIALLQQSGAHIVHCPESNLKPASGFRPVARLQEAGVNVALGSDGGASNNDLDMFGEMKTAALLAKAVGSDAIVGSLEPGKRADITAVARGDLEMQPLYNPASQLVYASVGQRVTHVWVDGTCLLSERVLQTMDEARTKGRAGHWRRKIAQ